MSHIGEDIEMQPMMQNTHEHEATLKALEMVIGLFRRRTTWSNTYKGLDNERNLRGRIDGIQAFVIYDCTKRRKFRKDIIWKFIPQPWNQYIVPSQKHK
jgi:hypothetical protein